MSITGQLRLIEDVDLISETTINGLLYGIALSLFFLCVQSLYPQLKDPHLRRQAIFMLGYTSVVMICGFVFLALFTQIIQLAYIDHNTSLGEPIVNEQVLFGQPIGVGQGAFSTVMDALTLGIQLWRLWMIYNATQYAIIIMVLPVLLYLGVIGATDTSKLYLGIVTMLIESYALESAWALAALISYVVKGAASVGLFNNCSGAIEMIAYLLVVYRVSTGRAWSKNTGQQITRSLQFNHGTGHTTQTTGLETATQTSQTHTDASTVASNPLPLAQSAV
ncbi:hypothetical protein P691DRAFT_781788 [Macrolepiota fuliginosa MF-IS2]|uniref:Uncharacterized protein n=1 Tax=Macrolepiota fuliginosa MF-IS2 TaxID=1400762 RepID=A0A9P5WXF1_9AGAR|nr:hypothetical protein P691DRAFT_781788 [Macrolepiota fuliginosa MF-IS2]